MVVYLLRLNKAPPEPETGWAAFWHVELVGSPFKGLCWTVALTQLSSLLFDSRAAASLPVPCGTGFGCHGSQPGIRAVYDKGCYVGGPGLRLQERWGVFPPGEKMVLTVNLADGHACQCSTQYTLILCLAPSSCYTNIFPQINSCRCVCGFCFTPTLSVSALLPNWHVGNMLSPDPISVSNPLTSTDRVSRCPTGYPALSQDVVRDDNGQCTIAIFVQRHLGGLSKKSNFPPSVY